MTIAKIETNQTPKQYDVERADVNVLDDVISVRDGYKQCDLSKDEIILTIEIICTN